MSAPEAERLARVTFSVGVEPGHRGTNERVHAEGGAVVLERCLRSSQPDPRTRAEMERLGAVDPERELEKAGKAGLRFVIPGDDEWPTGLDDLDHIAPLHERGGVPVGLWLRGPGHLAQACEDAVAVVGARAATTYGADLAASIAAGLAQAGHPVVSGAAYGIDQAAHRGALAMEGTTIAVLACGADRVYPASNRALIEHIARHGVVVSEAPPGAAPMRIRFLARNRLIAAMSRGTVVVEAAIRSGALNTASWADLLGRQVMGVPGPVTSAASEGVHDMVRNRGALLVTSAEQVSEAVGPVGTLALPDPRAPDRPRDRLDPRQREVLEAVPVQRGAPLESIARIASLPPQEAHEVLVGLFRAGFVERHDNHWRLAEEEARAG